MTIIRQPKVTVNKLPAVLAQGLEEQKILVINQKLSTGSATSGLLYENIAKSQIKDLVGEGSFAQNSLNAIFDVFEKSGSLKLPSVDVIPLDDAGAGTESTATLTISEVGGVTDLATVAGTISIILGSKFLYTFDIDISIDQGIVSGTGNISDAIADAINANAELPVSAVNVAGTITLTCKHKGTIGDGITVKTEGLTLSGSDYVLGNVKLVITAFSGGATDPVMPDLDTITGGKRYQTVTHPIEYGITFSVTNFLDDRFNVDNKILDGVCIVKQTDTLANLKTALGLLNSQSLVYLCDNIISEDQYKGSALIDLDFVLSSRVSASRALRLTTDANISRLVLTPESNDQFGGLHIATLPYFNTPIFSISPIDTGIGFTEIEIEELADEGGSVVGNNIVGNTVILGEMLTTYKTDAGANPDPTWHFLNAVDTLSVSAEYFFNNIKNDFVQSRLTDGDLVDGYSMVNEASFKGQMKKYYIDLSEFVIVPSGKTSIDFFIDNLDVILDLLQGKITASASLPIVVQLREILVNLTTTFK